MSAIRTVAAVALVFASLAPAAAQEGLGASAGEAAAGGRITGVVLGDGAPLANAEVWLATPGAAGRGRGVATDAKGEFEIDGLDGPAYYLFASAASYFAEETAGGERPLHRPGERVTLRLFKGGVITGKVVDREGWPVVGCPVRAYHVRAESDRPLEAPRFYQPRETDDRGVYRIYGLPPGAYVVSAGGERLGGSPSASIFSGDGHVYYPSSSRSGAAEVRVSAGGEATGIDIAYRAVETHVVSGSLSGPVSEGGWKTVRLTTAGEGIEVGNGQVERRGDRWTFEIPAVADGEYELTATTFDERRLAGVSEPLRVAVRGADVTGLTLAVVPVGAIEGRVAVERAPREGACEKLAEAPVTGTAVGTRAERRPTPFTLQSQPALARPDGAFLLEGLSAGRHWLDVRVPDDSLYVKSVALMGRDAARDGVAVAGGKTVAGVAVTLADGAASVSGRVSAEGERALPRDVAVHIVPAEPERAGDALRYHVAWAEPDGSFTVRNVAPGRYRAVAIRPPDEEPAAAWGLRVAREPALRDRLRRDAEAAGVAVDLTPCGQASDIVVAYREAQKPERRQR